LKNGPSCGDRDDENAFIQTKSIVENGISELQGQSVEEEKEMLRAKPLSQQRVNDGIRISSETPTIVNEVLSSTGQPLDIETRNYFELPSGMI